MHRTLLRRALVALSLGPCSLLSAATLGWTGAGSIWTNPASWNPARVPASGDTLVYGAAGGGDSFANVNGLAIDTLRFDAAVLPLHLIRVQAPLTFSGFGIRNDSTFVSGGVIRQQLFAESGATVVFQNNATIGGATLPVDFTARAGSTIRFENTSTASSPTDLLFTGLIVEGGAELRFRDDASTGYTATLVNRGGATAGAAGGSVIFQDRALLAYRLTNGVGDGLGGRVVFQGNAQAQTGGAVENDGAITVGAGAEALTQFLADSRFSAGAQNRAAGVATGRGGRLEFRERADATDASIFNGGSRVGGAESGRLQFFDQATAASAVIVNAVASESAVAGTEGGATEFFGFSRADAAQIRNEGAPGANSVGGRTLFREDSDAQSATIANEGGRTANAPGGLTEFSGRATAGAATLEAQGGSGAALGGRIVFRESSRGGTARAVLLRDSQPGLLDLSPLAGAGTTLGSIEGAGLLSLGAKTLTVGGNDLSTEFSGVVQDGGLGGGNGGALTKTGAGILTLSGGNTYTGATLVSGGRLLVNGALARGGVDVEAGATLGGRGTIAGPVTVADGGALAPGPAGGAGTLTVAALTLGAGATLKVDLGTPGAAGNDRVDVTGNLVLDGGLEVANLGGLSFGTYRLFNYGGALTNRTLSVSAVPAGFAPTDFAIDLGTPGQVNLLVSGGSSAAILYWDGPNVLANAVVDGGTGTWDNTIRSWTNVTGTGNTFWGGGFAIFSGTPGIVTLADNVTTTGMQFSTDGYLLNASGGAALTLNGFTSFRVDAGRSATINVPLTGSGNLFKVDVGTLTLTAPSSYTGFTYVSDGILVVREPSGRGLGSGSVSNAPTLTQELRFAGNGSAGTVRILNQGSTTTGNRALTTFVDTASAADAFILNEGPHSSAGTVGVTLLLDQATGGNATIDNVGASYPNSFIDAGQLQLWGDATAGASTVINRGGVVALGHGGRTSFFTRSSAGSASVSVDGGTVSGARGGVIQFYDFASGGTAAFLNRAGAVAGAEGGTISFISRNPTAIAPSAGNASFINEGARFGPLFPESARAQVLFRRTATAGAASFLNQSARTADAPGGQTNFYDLTTAGTAQFVNEGAAVFNGYAGLTRFFNTSNADRARITNQGTAVVAGREGGIAYFNDLSSAGNATIDNEAGAIQSGASFFSNSATAGNAQITNHGSATSALPGGTYFRGSTSAGNATITNRPPAVAGSTGGWTFFYESATAANATITAQGGSGIGSSYIGFSDTANAGTAMLIAESGVAGGRGGLIQFAGATNGASARLVLQAGAAPGTLDLTTVTGSGLSVGSIEGGGRIALGTKALSVTGDVRDTEFSGQITGTGPNALYKSGSKTLTLSGINTFTGQAYVTGGTLAVNGSIVGGASVGAGATLRGIGTIGGTVVVAAGGTYAPGTSPGTLTVGGLEFDDAAILEYELGAGASDQTIVQGDLILDGILHIANAGGLTAGRSYELFRWTGQLTDRGLRIGSVPPGFSVNDFAFEVVGGAMRLAVGRGGSTGPNNVTASLQIEASGYRLNRATQRFVQTLTLRNASAQAIAGPVSLVLDALPAGVTLAGATGTTTSVAPLGSPFLGLDVGADGALTPNETLTLNVEFANPANLSITYTPRVLAGPGGR